MINPQKIYGDWEEGFALDIHTISSEFIAYDNAGNPRFDTKRSIIGELIYALKYGNNIKAADEIIGLALPFVKSWLKNKNFDIIIPTPFSHQRKLQPVYVIAEKLALLLEKEFKADLFVNNSLGEAKNQNKDIIIMPSRYETLNSGVLLVDDIFQTGATLNACVKVLKEHYKVKSVLVLCITQRRKTFVYV